MDNFKYKPLDLEQHAFRLIRLAKGSGPEIECELIHAFLDGGDIAPYDALSYTWGNPEITKSIKLNDKRFNITENLFHALQHLRLQDVDRMLWVDAVCIDQAHKEELGHQVRQMGKIYSQAHQVIIWLGLGTFGTDVLMDSLKTLHEKCNKYAYRGWSTTDQRWMDLWLQVQESQASDHGSYLQLYQRRGIKQILERSWFRRVWILQEVANAKLAIICVGTKSISSSIFALAPWLVGVPLEHHCQVVFDIMPGQSRKTSWWNEKRDLYTLLRKFNGSEATDSRDQIYALLGISSDAYDSDNIRADYTKTPSQVINTASLFLFGISGSQYHTMSEFLDNLTSLNQAALREIVHAKSVTKLADFLNDRGNDSSITITEEIFRAAVHNREHGKEVVEFLCKQPGKRGCITEEVVMAALGNRELGQQITPFLLEKHIIEINDTTSMGKGVIDSSEFWQSRNAVLLLLEQRKDRFMITEEMLQASARYLRSKRELTSALLKRYLLNCGGNKFEIEEAIKALEINWRTDWTTAPEVFYHQRPETANKIVTEVIGSVAEDWRCEVALLALLLRHHKNKVRIPEYVLLSVMEIWKSVEEIIILLFDKERHDPATVEAHPSFAPLNTRNPANRSPMWGRLGDSPMIMDLETNRERRKRLITFLSNSEELKSKINRAKQRSPIYGWKEVDLSSRLPPRTRVYLSYKEWRQTASLLNRPHLSVRWRVANLFHSHTVKP